MPPSLLIKQASSVFSLSLLTGWKKFPRWTFRNGFNLIRGASGAKGMGCIGFPDHPVWEITNACNLRCAHCHCSGGKPAKYELSREEGKNLLEQLAEIDEFRMMAFTGGEPLLRKDLFELLNFSNSLGFTNTIATNATLIDSRVARKLSRNGVAIAAVSLDGSTPDTHDKVRGVQGSFHRAMRGMRALRNEGIVLHINITLMNFNLSEMKDMVKLVEELDAGILLIYQLVPLGRGAMMGDSVLDVSNNEKLIKFMSEIQRRANIILEPVAGPQYWAYLLKKEGIEGGVKLRMAEKVFHGCSAGRGFVYIKPNGDAWPCPFIEVSAGNIRESAFKDIWRNSEIFKDLRNREELLKGHCGECEYKTVCGGCRGRAWAATGDYLAPDPSCFLYDRRGEK